MLRTVAGEKDRSSGPGSSYKASWRGENMSAWRTMMGAVSAVTGGERHPARGGLCADAQRLKGGEEGGRGPRQAPSTS